jgi:hypothetical protein
MIIITIFVCHPMTIIMMDGRPTRTEHGEQKRGEEGEVEVMSDDRALDDCD